VRTSFACALTSYWLARSRLSFKHPIHVLSGQMAEMATNIVGDHQVDDIGFRSCHCGTMVQRRSRGCGEASSSRTMFSPAFHTSILRMQRQENDRHFLVVHVRKILENLFRGEPSRAHGNSSSKNVSKSLALVPMTRTRWALAMLARPSRITLKLCLGQRTTCGSSGFRGLFSNHYVVVCAAFSTLGGLIFGGCLYMR
jgi:hypothetical protein